MNTSKRNIVIAAIVVGVVLVAWAAFFLNHNTAWIGEQAGNSNYWHKAVGLVTDMPHATAELFYSAIDNILTWIIVILIARPYLKRRDAKIHAQLDAEHGYEHSEDGEAHKI